MTGRGKKEVLSRDFLLRLVSKTDHVLYDLEEGGWANLLWKILANCGDSEIYPGQFSQWVSEGPHSFWFSISCVPRGE